MATRPSIILPHSYAYDQPANEDEYSQCETGGDRTVGETDMRRLMFTLESPSPQIGQTDQSTAGRTVHVRSVDSCDPDTQYAFSPIVLQGLLEKGHAANLSAEVANEMESRMTERVLKGGSYECTSSAVEAEVDGLVKELPIRSLAKKTRKSASSSRVSSESSSGGGRVGEPSLKRRQKRASVKAETESYFKWKDGTWHWGTRPDESGEIVREFIWE